MEKKAEVKKKARRSGTKVMFCEAMKEYPEENLMRICTKVGMLYSKLEEYVKNDRDFRKKVELHKDRIRAKAEDVFMKNVMGGNPASGIYYLKCNHPGYVEQKLLRDTRYKKVAEESKKDILEEIGENLKENKSAFKEGILDEN